MSNYPANLDTFRTLENQAGVPFDEQRLDTMFSQDFNAQSSGIRALQETLGPNPMGIYQSVAERLDAFDPSANVPVDLVRGRRPTVIVHVSDFTSQSYHITDYTKSYTFVLTNGIYNIHIDDPYDKYGADYTYDIPIYIVNAGPTGSAVITAYIFSWFGGPTYPNTGADGKKLIIGGAEDLSLNVSLRPNDYYDNSPNNNMQVFTHNQIYPFAYPIEIAPPASLRGDINYDTIGYARRTLYTYELKYYFHVATSVSGTIALGSLPAFFGTQQIANSDLYFPIMSANGVAGRYRILKSGAMALMPLSALAVGDILTGVITLPYSTIWEA